ncbi:MAG: hypothetical protein L0I76_26215 [Pseudonocardia sp.]|nr:hypothetical protein [Pseudonocardia sp.]
MNAAELTTVELITRLRAWAEGYLPGMAAVELLIAHSHWLTSPGFLALVTIDNSCLSGTPMASIDWDALAWKDDRRPPVIGSDSELAVLAVACSIGGGEAVDLQQVVLSLDSRNIQLVVNTLLMANGRR